MTNDTLDFVTRKLLDQAKLMGADEADVIATKGQSLNVDVRQGAVSYTHLTLPTSQYV